jgi:uncharacterized membrane protein
MEQALHALISGSLATACALAAGLFGWFGVAWLAWGGLRALFHVGRASLLGASHVQARLDLGRHLALSLEFLVAKDVLDSIVEPTWDELGKLAAIVVLRTVIQFALARELHEVAANEH